MEGGGSVLIQHTHVKRKRMVNVTLEVGHDADPAHCYIFIIYGEFAVYNSLQHYFVTEEDKARIDSQQYSGINSTLSNWASKI